MTETERFWDLVSVKYKKETDVHINKKVIKKMKDAKRQKPNPNNYIEGTSK